MSNNQSKSGATQVSDTEQAKPEGTVTPLPDKKAKKKAAAREAHKLNMSAVPPEPIYAPARRAKAKRRHFAIVLGFVLFVLVPFCITAWYLYDRAVDQFASNVGFTVRQEEAPSPVEFLGSLPGMSTSSTSDSDILFEFIKSQELVEKVDEKLDLQSIYGRHYEQDPLFSLAPDSPIEDLVSYWRRMVMVNYAPGTGLLELKILAFTPEEAQTIATEIFNNSSDMINKLSSIAREDATRYAREELETAVRQLTEARQALTAFRSQTQIVDPGADIQVQMGLLNTLQQELGTELINYDLLLLNAQSGDPRLTQSEQRIVAIEARIAQERRKIGSGSISADGQNYATLVSEFERLMVEREFTEQKYTVALSNFDIAQAEAQRQSRYLAAYLNPTMAETAEYPRRELLLALTGLFLLLAWSTGALIFYSLRDRR